MVSKRCALAARWRRTLRNNIVYRVAEAGIHLWHDANNVVIVNNTVAGSNTGIVVGGGDYYYTRGPNDHTYVFNNIVFDNKMGIFEQGATGKPNGRGACPASAQQFGCRYLP